MPFECVVTRCAARNHCRSGRCVLCMTVPAMTEVCLRHGISSPCSSAFSPPHSKTHGFDRSFQPFSDPQCGQTNPSGQRFFARYAAQEWSSGKCSWNCSSERGRSYRHLKTDWWAMRLN